MRKTVILIVGKDFEIWSTLKGCCEAHEGFQYHSIKMNSFPFTHKGWSFHRVPFNQLH